MKRAVLTISGGRYEILYILYSGPSNFFLEKRLLTVQQNYIKRYPVSYAAIKILLYFLVLNSHVPFPFTTENEIFIEDNQTDS